MGNPANQREDDDSQEVRVSGVRLAVVVSPEEAALGLPEKHPSNYDQLVVYPHETIDVWGAVQEIVTTQVTINEVEGGPQPAKATGDWAAERLAAKQRRLHRDRLIKAFLLRRLLPPYVFQYVEALQCTMLQIALMQSSPDTMMDRLMGFFIEAVNMEEGIEARARLMRSLQQELDNLQYRTALPGEERLFLFRNLDEVTEDPPSLSGLAEEIILEFRRELRRADPARLGAMAQELQDTEARRYSLADALVSRARSNPSLLEAIGRWLRYDGTMAEFDACLALLGDVESVLQPHRMTVRRVRELAPQIRLDLLTRNNASIRKFAELIIASRAPSPSP